MVKHRVKLLSGAAMFFVLAGLLGFLPQLVHAASKNTRAAATDPYTFTAWTADCDSNHNPYSPTVKYTWQGLQVCYPDNHNDESYHEASLNGELEFQCTELVKRFLYVAYGYAPISQTDGSGIVDAYTRAYPALHKIPNNGSVHLVPSAGDVISYGTEPASGHTSIVTSSSQNSNGTWNINIIQQNAWTNNNTTPMPTQTLTMGTDWIIQTPSGFASITSWMTTRLPPGGWWIGPTGTWGSSNTVAANTVIHVGFQAVDNGNGGLNHVDFTESTNNGASWNRITTLDPTKPVGNGQIQYFAHFTLTAPTILSADVYSTNGNFHLAPQGFKFICIQGGSCPVTTFAYWDGSTYGGADLGGTEPSQPTSTCTAGSNQVALFVDPNYGGSCVVLGIGSYTDPTAIGLPNDSISSVKVGGGAQVELCRDAGLSNTCEWISTNVPDLSTHSVGDNQVSSAQIMGGVATTGCTTPGTDQVTLFDSTNYGGLCITKEIGTYPDPGSMGLPNDSVQSVEVGSDVKVELCRDSGLSNTCEWISTNVPDLSTHSIGKQQASSAEVSLNGGISLCDGTNFTGNCKSFPDGMTNLSDYGWANRARSVKFSDVYNHHYHIVLYTGTNETGYLYHADSDVADLGSPYDGNIQSINIYPHTIPSAPSSPTPADQTVLANDTTSVTLSWSGSDQAQIHVWNDAYNFTDDWQSSNSLQLTNLTPGVYFWQVQAQDDMGPGPWSPVWTFSINTPPQVGSGSIDVVAGSTEDIQVQAVDADNQSLTMSASNVPGFASFSDNGNGIGIISVQPSTNDAGTYTINVTASDGALTGSGTITLTVPSTTPSGTELLSSSWALVGNNGATEQDEPIASDTVQGMQSVQVTFNLHGTSFGNGDDEASIVFVQDGDWRAANVIINGGQNGLDGSQSLTIPLSAFHKVGDSSTVLDPTQPVSNLHARFWNTSSFTVDITSILVEQTTTSATPTPTPTSTPTPTPSGVQPFTVYDEGLAANWGDWSWCSDNDLADTAHPNTGSYDISWTVTCAYGGLALHLPSGFDTTGYTSLTFALGASEPGQTVQISLYDSSGNTGIPVQLDSYGSTPAAEQYTTYTIPISAFQSTGTITGILIQDITGNSTEPPMYVDTIVFQ
jgi:hypothetical protein